MTVWDQGDLLWTMCFPTLSNGIYVILTNVNLQNVCVFGGLSKLQPVFKTCILLVHTSDSKWRCQSSAAVTRPHGNVQDVGLNPAGARNENQTLGDTSTEGGPLVWTLSGRPVM